MREYLTIFLVAAAVTYLLGVFARELALRTGAVARVRDRDVHAVPIPYFGGVAMLGGLVAAYLVARRLPFLSQQSPDAVVRDASNRSCLARRPARGRPGGPGGRARRRPWPGGRPARTPSRRRGGRR